MNNMAIAKKKPTTKRKTPVARKKMPVKNEYVIYSGKHNEFMSDVSAGKVNFGPASKAVIFPSKKLADSFLNILLSFPNSKTMALQVLKK